MQANPDEPLVSLLRSQGLSLKLRQFIIYAVAMAEKDQEVLEHHFSHRPSKLPSVPSVSSSSSSIAQFSTPSQHNSAKHEAAQHDAAQHEAAQQGATQRDTEATAEGDTLGAVSSSGDNSNRPDDSAQHRDTNIHTSSTWSPHSNSADQQPLPSGQKPLEGQLSEHAATSKHNTRPAQQCAPSSGEQHQHHSAVATAVEGLLSTEAGVVAMRQYVDSVGRYGPNTGPLLTPMYGCGELPQAFCR